MDRSNKIFLKATYNNFIAEMNFYWFQSEIEK